MRNIVYICTLVCLAFGLIYGNDCEKKNENHNKAVQHELGTNDGEGSFVFYIKPLTKGKLSISLHKRDSPGTSSAITHNLFTTTLNDANSWYKINIRRGNVRNQFFPSKLLTRYSLKVNDQTPHTSNEIEVGNEIRLKTVQSSWSFTCDPRQYKPPPQPAITLLPPTQPPSSPTPQPLPPATTTTNTATNITVPTSRVVNTPKKEDKGFLDTITDQIPLWQLVVIATVSLVLILAVILVTVVLVLRHKRRKRDPAMIQPTDHQSRLSRHVSENSLYEGYDNQVVGPAAGTTGLGSHGTLVDHIYEEPHPQDNSATNSANNSGTNSDTNSADQKRGSAHDSENSLYVGFS